MDNLSQYQPTEADNAERDFIFARMEYEMRPFSVSCEACGCVASDSQQKLEQSGWTLNRSGEWCPNDKPLPMCVFHNTGANPCRNCYYCQLEFN